MKQVKFNGSRWILLTPNGGFFNPATEVYFFIHNYGSHNEKIAKLIQGMGITPRVGEVYEIPDNGIYTSVCGPKCGPFWPDENCMHCGGRGVGARFDDDSGMQMGGTDIGNEEIENIKNGVSNIHPEL
jgi:hypothetical protein